VSSVAVLPEPPWQCSCHACKASRLLLQPHLLMLGKRSFYEDIAAAMDFLKREDSLPARFMLIRNVRKLLRRFDPVLWEGEEKKISKGGNALSDINDFLLNLEPGREPLPIKERDRGFKIIEKSVPDLEKLIPATIPINQIRRISTWSHRGSGGIDSIKIVTIEQAESMQESSRNALLKLLEEPPVDLYLIMMTERKRMILPTILSRVRNYSFKGRGTRATRDIINRLYREKTSVTSFEEYFGQYRSSGEENMADLADSYLQDLCSKEKVFPSKIFETMAPAEIMIFYQELFRILRIWQRRTMKGEGSLPLAVMEEWNKMLREGYASIETYNQNPLLILESVYYRMREI
jgi:hypothetical protein